MTAALAHPLSRQGFATSATIHPNLGTAALVEEALKRGEGRLTKDGALLVDTGKFTGRSVKDKYRRSRCDDRNHDQLGRDQPADVARALGGAEGRFPLRA